MFLNKKYYKDRAEYEKYISHEHSYPNHILAKYCRITGLKFNDIIDDTNNLTILENSKPTVVTSQPFVTLVKNYVIIDNNDILVQTDDKLLYYELKFDQVNYYELANQVTTNSLLLSNQNDIFFIDENIAQTLPKYLIKQNPIKQKKVTYSKTTGVTEAVLESQNCSFINKVINKIIINSNDKILCNDNYIFKIDGKQLIVQHSDDDFYNKIIFSNEIAKCVIIDKSIYVLAEKVFKIPFRLLKQSIKEENIPVLNINYQSNSVVDIQKYLNSLILINETKIEVIDISTFKIIPNLTYKFNGQLLRKNSNIVFNNFLFALVYHQDYSRYYLYLFEISKNFESINIISEINQNIYIKEFKSIKNIYTTLFLNFIGSDNYEYITKIEY